MVSRFYTEKAKAYAAHYGINSYTVKGNLMIYKEEFVRRECNFGIWQDVRYNFEHALNLNTGEIYTKRINDSRMGRYARV